MQVNMDYVEYVTETALTIRGSRRRTTVPKVIVDKFELRNGDKIRWLLFKDAALITKVKKAAEKSLKSMSKLCDRKSFKRDFKWNLTPQSLSTDKRKVTQ